MRFVDFCKEKSYEIRGWGKDWCGMRERKIFVGMAGLLIPSGVPLWERYRISGVSLQSRRISGHALESRPPSWFENRESLGWVQQSDPGCGCFRSPQSPQFARTKMAAETIGWIYPLPNKTPALQANPELPCQRTHFRHSSCPCWQFWNWRHHEPRIH